MHCVLYNGLFIIPLFFNSWNMYFMIMYYIHIKSKMACLLKWHHAAMRRSNCILVKTFDGGVYKTCSNFYHSMIEVFKTTYIAQFFICVVRLHALMNGSLGTAFRLAAKVRANNVIDVTKYVSKRTGLTLTIADIEGPMVHGYLTLG